MDQSENEIVSGTHEVIGVKNCQSERSRKPLHEGVLRGTTKYLAGIESERAEFLGDLEKELDENDDVALPPPYENNLSKISQRNYNRSCEIF